MSPSGRRIAIAALLLTACASPRPWVAVTRICQPNVARCERGTLVRAFPTKAECEQIMGAWAEAKRTRMSLRGPTTMPTCVEVDLGSGDQFVPDLMGPGPMAR